MKRQRPTQDDTCDRRTKVRLIDTPANVAGATLQLPPSLSLKASKSSLDSATITRLKVCLAAHAVTLRELDLSGSFELSSNILLQLSGLTTNLLSLNLSYCNYLTDEDVTILLGTPISTNDILCLQKLNLSHTSITDSAFRKIVGRCPYLTHVNLEGCTKLTDVSLSLLAQHCKQVSHLVVSECPKVSDLGIQLVAQESKQHLQTLDLNECSISDRSLLYLGYYCPSLSCLRVKGTQISAAVLAKLLPRLRLHELNVQGLPITNDFLELLSHHQPSLRILDVGFCYNLTLEGIRTVVESCTSLQELYLFGISCSDLDLDSLSSSGVRVHL